MTGKDVISQLKNEGLFVFDIPAVDSAKLKACFRAFLENSNAYKLGFLQHNYNFGFDGYSYQGQEDSSNQEHDDLLDSFVFSDLRHVKKFPTAFHSYLNHGWKKALAQIEGLEKNLLEELNLDINQKDLAHMVSCNYYPPTQNFKNVARENTRLSAHPDVSLFTVFPFGVEKGFSYQNPKGKWIELAANNQWTVFPGYLLECLTDGAIKALNHKVVLPENRKEERFSFAFFSIPRQNTTWSISSKTVSAEAYFEKYLGLFNS